MNLELRIKDLIEDNGSGFQLRLEITSKQRVPSLFLDDLRNLISNSNYSLEKLDTKYLTSGNFEFKYSLNLIRDSQIPWEVKNDYKKLKSELNSLIKNYN